MTKQDLKVVLLVNNMVSRNVEVVCVKKKYKMHAQQS